MVQQTKRFGSMQPFYKTVHRTPSEYFVPNVLNKRNLPQIQYKNICLTFNHAKEGISSKKMQLGY